ncbi:MAG TPA: glycosyltransferase family 39 protein, partial [Gaiellaceae bacterium]|nr:glycosyltransferase family 39 protein [Gaiellaceae bacterium]
MSWRGPLRSPSSFWAGTAAAVLLGAVVSARAIYQAPLNVDEELTRRIASGRFGSIFSIVVNQRGGGPVHFWLVHLTLQWPGGLIGLRAPSLVFFLLALPAVALLARELAGVTAGVVTVLLTSCAPLAVTYATFGRPHTLLFAWISWGTFVALRAARTGSRGWWIVGGLILGTAVFTHPTAPIYELAAFAAALALAPQPPRELLRRAWPGAVALALTTIPYEAVTARVISNRYGVSASARHGRTFDHKPVWQNAVRFVSPDGHGRLLNWLTVLAVAGVATLILRRRHRELAAVAVVLVLPVL